MTPNQMKHILRTAVIAALPVTLQTGCAIPAPTPIASPEPNTNITCKSSTLIPLIIPVTAAAMPKSFGECAKLCQDTIQKRFDSSIASLPQTHNPPKLEEINVSECGSRLDTKEIHCTATYTDTQILTVPQLPSGTTPACPAPGRMPAGLHIHEYETSNALGHYFAQMTAMESAAVTAFRYLLRELEAYQAPLELVEATHAAIGEEINHAKLAGMLAKAYDAPIPRIEVEDFQLRSLYEIALENAIEGCVNETFAAACGLWQQEHAEHATFRAVIAHVTEDECNHAALSWAIHDWAMPQLTPAEQTHIRQAQAEAVDKLALNFLREEHPVVCRAVGLPETTNAARLFQQLRTALWEPRIQA